MHCGNSSSSEPFRNRSVIDLLETHAFGGALAIGLPLATSNNGSILLEGGHSTNPKTMCGIAGFTHLNRSVARNTIGKAISLLSHRGPDDLGTHFYPNCSIGATRLKIIDFLDGRQ